MLTGVDGLVLYELAYKTDGKTRYELSVSLMQKKYGERLGFKHHQEARSYVHAAIDRLREQGLVKAVHGICSLTDAGHRFVKERRGRKCPSKLRRMERRAAARVTTTATRGIPTQ